MSVLEHVAGNVRRLREQAGLSQQALSERSGVSRRMLVGIESGESNVSLNTLDRLGDALGVRFATLVQAPSSPGHHRIGEVAWQGKDEQSSGTLLASCAAQHEVELWRWELAPGAHYLSSPDMPGWQEMVFVVEGELIVELADSTHRVGTGDYLAFARDTREFTYRNGGEGPVRFIRNVAH